MCYILAHHLIFALKDHVRDHIISYHMLPYAVYRLGLYQYHAISHFAGGLPSVELESFNYSMASSLIQLKLMVHITNGTWMKGSGRSLWLF